MIANPQISLSNEQWSLLRLSCIEGIGPITGRGLIEHFGSATEVLNATRNQLAEVPGIKRKLVDLILDQSTSTQKAEKELETLNTLAENGSSINLYFLGDEEYPAYLAHCFDAPLVMYVKGQIPYDAPMISIVGTRRNTIYSEEALRLLISGFAKHRPDLVIVSGLAYGVDRLAHELALEYGLRSLAVVAHGHYTTYPAAHIGLARRIVETGGGIISEYTYHTRALPQRFVARNRIVAGLSLATIIAESAVKGGALITGNIAFDYGRQVYAVPGRLFDKASEGCNKMIALQKASIATSPEYILEDLNLLDSKPKQLTLPFDEKTEEDTHPILQLLHEVGELTIEDLALRLGEELPTISAQLFDLELDDKIRALPGGKYIIKNI